MSVLTRKYVFSKCIELIQMSKRSIGIRNSFGNRTLHNNPCASILCSKYTYALIGRNADITVNTNRCTSIRFKSNKKDEKQNRIKNDDEDSDEVGMTQMLNKFLNLIFKISYFSTVGYRR